MTKPAILHIITRLDLGGAQKSCLALIAHLQQNYPDFDVYLISGSRGELVPQAQNLQNVQLLDTLIWEIHPKNLVLELKNFLKLVLIMRKLQIKHKKLIIHTHTIKAGTLGRWAAWVAGVKIRVHTIHGFSFHPYQNKLVWLIFYLIELFNSLITTHFICVSSQDLNAGREIFPKFAQKSSIIRAATLYRPQGCSNIPGPGFAQGYAGQAMVSVLRSKKYRIQPVTTPQIITIGTIASLKPGKNLFELLKAFKFAQKQLKSHSITLHLQIVGDGPLRPALEAYLTHHHLTSTVQITGWTPNPMLYAQKWSSFVFTSLWEGLPCALVEIKELEIPILAYQVGGLPDLIDQSRLICPPKWLMLANQLVQSQLNPQNQPTRPTSPDFYIPKMAQDHIKLYKSLL
jgi:glycosyltransferase involved in cell wall biosynthesis